MIEKHLKQRIAAQAAFRLQGFDQLLERQVLMALGVQRPVLGLLQQLGDRQLRIEIAL